MIININTHVAAQIQFWESLPSFRNGDESMILRMRISERSVLESDWSITPASL